MLPLKTQAIQTALTGNWQAAVDLNKKILEETPEDIETLNRLAFALAILGKIRDAKTIYQKVLKLDTQNPIAIRNLKRLTDKNSEGACNAPCLNNEMDTMFIEESGKTKVIELLNVAERKKISHLMIGEPLTFRVKRFKIFVLDSKEQYTGMLPDDLGKRLIKFMKGGNTYCAYVKCVEENSVTIFIKETKMAACFKNQPSFVYPSLKNKINIKHNFKAEEEDEEETKEEDN